MSKDESNKNCSSNLTTVPSQQHSEEMHDTQMTTFNDFLNNAIITNTAVSASSSTTSNQDNYSNIVDVKPVIKVPALSTLDPAPSLLAPIAVENAESEFVVDKILNKRFIEGQVEYLLKWKGYSITDCSWEPYENITAKDLVEQYEREALIKEDLIGYVLATEEDVSCIIGITRRSGRLELMVHFNDGRSFLLPARFVSLRFPKKLAEFFERHFRYLPEKPRDVSTV